MPRLARDAYFAMLNASSMYILLAKGNPEVVLEGSMRALQDILSAEHNPTSAAAFVRMLHVVVGSVAHDDFLAWESLRTLEPGQARDSASREGQVVKYMKAASAISRFESAVAQYQKVVANAQYVAVFKEESRLVSEMTVGLNLNWTERHIKFWRARVDALHAEVVRHQGLIELARVRHPREVGDLQGPPPAPQFGTGASRLTGNELEIPVSDPSNQARVAGVPRAHNRRTSRSRRG